MKFCIEFNKFFISAIVLKSFMYIFLSSYMLSPKFYFLRTFFCEKNDSMQFYLFI